MNRFLQTCAFLSLVGCASGTLGADIQAYYYWNLQSGEGWINDPALWTSEDGATTGYVPGTTPNGADNYQDWAVVRNTGVVKIDDAHNPWGSFAPNFPQNIWVGHGSATYRPGPFPPSAGHVVQLSGAIGYMTYFIVGRGSGPEASTYDLQGGSITQAGSGGRIHIGDSTGGVGVGVMNITNGALLYAPAQAMRVGTGPSSNGTFSMSDTSQLSAQYLTAGVYGGDGADAVGTINIGGDATVGVVYDLNSASYYYCEGTINVSGTADLTVGRRINVGDNSEWAYRDAWATGSLNISDNATVTTFEIKIGKFQYGIGTATVASSTGTATLNASGNFAVGIAGGHGELIVGNGGLINHTAGWIDVGSDARPDPQELEVFTSTGTVTMNGGAFNHTDATNGIALGIDGQTGTWTHNGGSLVSASSVWFGQSGGHALLNLNGGTFQVPSIAVDPTSAPAAARVNFNGGTLQAGAAGELLVDATTPVLALVVQSGGAVIDSNGYDVAITPALVEDSGSTGGGLTKLGTGTLTLNGANSYSGDTIVSAGTLSTTGNSMLADDASLRIALGAVMNLNFSGTDSVGGLYLDGAAQAEGTWGAPGSGATFTNGVYFSGTGILMVDIASPSIPGDANGDGKVNAADAQALAANWGIAAGASWAMGDFNKDGAVNAADASILAANWGDHSREGQGAVPEPSTLASLVGLALLGTALVRRRS